MKNAFIIGLFALAVLACSTEKQPAEVNGKWFTYGEGGDYNELWISDEYALSYLGRLDELMLYKVARSDNRLDFTLLESTIVDSHEFSLTVTEQNDQLMKTIFKSSTRIDSLKTFFVIPAEQPVIAPKLESNSQNLREIQSRAKDEEDEEHSGKM